MPTPLEEPKMPKDKGQKAEEDKSGENGQQQDPDGNVGTFAKVLDGDNS